MGKKGEATKQNILDTARIMLWKHDYHRITVDQIVAEAGVNKASFYNYFKSKEELALEALRKNYQATIEFVYEGAFSSTQDPIERLEQIYERVYNSHSDVYETEGHSPGCPFVNLGVEMAFENEKIRQEVNHIFEGICVYWAQIYEDAKRLGLTSFNIPSHEMGRRLHTVLNGAMVGSRVRKRPQEVLDAINTAKAVLGVQIVHL